MLFSLERVEVTCTYLYTCLQVFVVELVQEPRRNVVLHGLMDRL